MPNAEWRITFPIEKAEARDDGLYLTGLASGPEIDSQGERMDGQLIHRFAEQINSRGDLPLDEKLVYRDAHAPDGVLRDLGWLTKAWVNNEGRLGVEVRLDEANPAATYLFRQITQRGKKYGMSVAGKVLDFADEFVADVGKTIRTYKDVVLTEISNTTRPAWTPSFGSVLSKAIDDAAAEAKSSEGEILMGDTAEELREETEATASAETEKAEEETTAEETTEKAEEAETEVEETTEEAEKSESAEDEDVEKAGRKFSATAVARLRGMYAEIGAALADLGVLEGETDPAEKSDSQDDGANVEKTEETPTETTQQPSVDELIKSITELTTKVQELENKTRTQVPPVIERAQIADDFMKSMADLSPEEKLRVAFAALHPAANGKKS